MCSKLHAALWNGSAEIGSPRSWIIGNNWSGSAVPSPTDINTFAITGDGVIDLNGSQSAGEMIFQNFTTTTVNDNGPGFTLTMNSPASGLYPTISTGEGVRHTYGCDYFTAGRVIAADLVLNDNLDIRMGTDNDSALMFSGQITAKSPTYNITLDNTAGASGHFQGNSLWITANNTNFHGTVQINSGTNNVRWGTALKLADAGRLDLAPITLNGDLAAVSLLALVNSTYNNTIASVSGGIYGTDCPVIHADRSYQTNDGATDTGRVMSIGNVVLDNPSTIQGDVSAIAFGSDSPYLRTHNEYIIEGKQLVLGTSAANTKKVYVNNGNFTSGLAGNRYLGGVNNMNISMNEARFLGDSNNVGLFDNTQDLYKYGPGILEIGGNNSTSSTGNKYIEEGVLRFTTYNSVGAPGTTITINQDAGLGIGWNIGLPSITVPGTFIGCAGALDIDATHFVQPLAFNTNPHIRNLRLGSSSRSGGTVAGPVSPQPSANGQPWHLLGGGGGTLTIQSPLNNLSQGVLTGLEMGTTGNLLPGRVILDPDAQNNYNGFTGHTMIYAGTLQPTGPAALEFSPIVSVNTTCSNFDGMYFNIKPANQIAAGTTFTFEAPGQFLLDPSVNYLFPAGKIMLEGGAVGWTGAKTINTIVGDVGTYGAPINSYLWWEEDLSGTESSAITNLLHLGGEYSQNIMTMGANCSINDNGQIPVALVKSGIHSTLDLSTGPSHGNSYTGGTAILGGELIVSDSKQVCGDRTTMIGGPILIANGGVLHVTADTTFANALKFLTKNTPDTSLNGGMGRMSTLFNGSVIEVDNGYTATFTGMLDGQPPSGGSRRYTTTTPFEKTGGGELYLDYQKVGILHAQYPFLNTDANHWGIKLTEGLVSTNQLPYVLVNRGGDTLLGDRSNGYVICNGGSLEVRSPDISFKFHEDATYITSPYWMYGFCGFASYQGTESTITVQDGAMFRVSAMTPNILMGTVIFDALDTDNDPTNNIFHLRMAADPKSNPEEGNSPGGDSRGTGTLDLRGGMVILTTRESKRVLPAEAGFTLKLNGGIFNGMPDSELNGNLIINQKSASGTPKIDGEEALPDWQMPLTPVTWTIAGTGTTSWRGTLEKIGLGTVAFNREKGAPVIVSSTTDTLKISAGTVEAGGSGDPFTDLAAPNLHLNILNNANFNIIQGTKDVAAINGTGNTMVALGATLLVGSSGPVAQGNFTIYGSADAGSVAVSGTTTVGDGTTPAYLWADSISGGTLTIGAGSTVTIKPIPGGSLGYEITPVPEPSTFILLILGAAGLLGCSYRCRK